MTQTMQKLRSDMAERDDVSTPALSLARVLDEAEQDALPREQTPQRPTPAPARTPRPFAYD